MRLFSRPHFFQIFILLIFYNTLILCGSQYFVYTKHWDLYWFLAFFYRELMLITSYFLAFLLFSYLPNMISRIIIGIVICLSLIALIIDIFLLFTFDTNLNSYLVIVALESNPRESADFFHNYLTLALFGVYVLAFVAGVILWRILPRVITISKQCFKIILSAFFASVVILGIMIYTQIKPLNEDWSDMLYHSGREIYRAIQKTNEFIKEYKKLNDNFDTLLNAQKHTKAKQPIKNIVIVIGESTQRDRWGIYGYVLDTTPHLSQRKHLMPENLLIFRDIIAPHAQTHESLSLMLTLANQENTQNIATTTTKRAKKQSIKQWYEYLNIIDAMRLGGYYSVGISNQEPISVFGNAAATIIKRADSAVFVNVNDKMSTTKFDESILPLLDNALNATKDENARFFVIHLMGNHAKYYNRYPSDFAYFTQDDMPCQNSENLRLKNAMIKENMHYDNALRYGDFVLDEIFKRFENDDSIVIFFGDHGEEIYDWRNFIGHSDSKMSRFLAEIPFIVFVSQHFKTAHPQVYKRLNLAQNRRYMNDDFMHTVLDIAGVNVAGYEARRSLIASNGAFLRQRKRLVGDKNGLRDYDKDLKAQKSYIQRGLCGPK